MEPTERLKSLVKVKDVTLKAFPAEWADAIGAEELAKLSKDELIELVRLTTSVRHGSWKALCRRAKSLMTDS